MNVNRVELAGRVLEHGGLRRTPAGLARLELRIRHESSQCEAGRERPVACEAEVLCFGEVAERLARVAPGSSLGLIGFLDRRGARDPRPILHVTEFELIQE